MEAIRYSETSGTTIWTTRRHIPEDDTLGTDIITAYNTFLSLEAESCREWFTRAESEEVEVKGKQQRTMDMS
jgi:hypothetical protein